MKTLPMFVLTVLLSSAIILSGCSKKETGTSPSGSSGGIDLSTPISELKTAAAQMDLAELEKMAQKYKDAIVAKTADLDKIKEQLKAIPMAQQMGEEAKGLQSDIAELGTAIKNLNDRLQVYVDYIKEKGGDIANYKM